VDQHKVERIQKFAARLILNNFHHATPYLDLLSTLKWHPIYRLVEERRLTIIKKYMNGTRFIPSCVFPLDPGSSNRCSQRIKERNRNVDNALQLKISDQQRNDRECKMSAARARLLRNSLNAETVRMPLKGFKKEIYSDEFFACLCEIGLIIPLYYTLLSILLFFSLYSPQGAGGDSCSCCIP
jgi:hypothetical protein